MDEINLALILTAIIEYFCDFSHKLGEFYLV
jgi:hypothetical protein